MANDLRAPKDALAKREGFYIIKDSSIQATGFPDGRRKEFYINDDRLISAAKIVGNVSDEEILELLKTAEGFKKLVHSVGISITSENRNSKFNVTMIMYGLKDMYGGGTRANLEVVANGVEQVMVFDDIDWSEDDNVLGQFAFAFPDNEEYAEASVRLYLNDGYHAPEEEDEQYIDMSGAEYKKIIAKSLIQPGNNSRIKKVIDKARRGEDVTMAFIGGSITQGAGAVPIATECYAYKTFTSFTEKYATDKSKMHYVKAGVGGTSSELGIVRYDHDVTSNGEIFPDIVVVEFAVNDAGDETEGECYEGLVRKVWNSKKKPAVILLFSVFADDYNLQERFIPIGNALRLPMVSLKDALVEQFNKKADDGRVVSRRQYFYDIFHPTNTGHTIMADCLMNCFGVIDSQETDESFDDIPVVKTTDFDDIKFFDRDNINDFVSDFECGDFDKTDEQLQGVERNMDCNLTMLFPDNWMHNEEANDNKPLSFKINCKLLLLVMKDAGEVNFGKAKVYVDGNLARVFDPHEIGWTHSNALIVIRENETKLHEVKVVMDDDSVGKRFTILGFGMA